MPSFSKDDIPPDWRELLGEYLESDSWKQLVKNVQALLEQNYSSVRPEPQHFFKALSLTPVDQVKVVIIGQDPYHSPGLAQGLAFSIPRSISIHSREFPSSLRNISKALTIEGFGTLTHGDLHDWARQGVLLLNTALSVQLGEAGSHTNLGWKDLVDHLIRALALKKPSLVWLLWGGHAQSKLPLIASESTHCEKALILQSSHPSGLGVYKTKTPFLEPGDKGSCQHFKKTNEWLIKQGVEPIQWVATTSQNPTQGNQEDLFS
jgi:uracil-DNA glycosylase